MRIDILTRFVCHAVKSQICKEKVLMKLLIIFPLKF